jgi:uncharacterized protein YfiM (DUF2279 family)
MLACRTCASRTCRSWAQCANSADEVTTSGANLRFALLLAALLGAALGPLAAAARAEDEFFAPDKSLHFGVSAAAALSCELVLASLELPPALRYPLALGLPLALGFGKELLDYARGGQASRADLAWDILGVATGLLIALVLETWLIDRPDARAAPERVAISSW